jgi:hypothetical protein
MALAMAMFAIVVIGALIAGAFFASTQDFRIGSNSLTAQRAFTAAEFGLNKMMAGWQQEKNLTVAIGSDTTATYQVGDGSTSKVTVTRLNGATYWFVSEGTSGVGTTVETKRRTSMVMRLAIPSIKVGGAVTLAGGGTVKGSAQVSGKNINPSGWDCANYPGRDTTGVAYAPGTSLTVQKASNVVGTPSSYADPNAGVDGNYIKYGDESWNSLAANADVKVLTNNPPDPAPDGTATTCNHTQNNWGEPWRSATNLNAVKGCETYFPIIYVTQDLQVNNGRGQGVLLIEGSLTVNGRFEWNGIIVVKDDINRGNGTPVITGAVMARNANIADAGTQILGNATFQYSQCAIQSAMQGSARLLPAHERAWAEMW